MASLQLQAPHQRAWAAQPSTQCWHCSHQVAQRHRTGLRTACAATSAPLTTVSNPGQSQATSAQILQQGPVAAPALPMDEEQRRKRLWKMAIKLPMYSVGYVPVLVGAAAVFYQTGYAPWLSLAGFLVAAVSIIAWLNLSNDYFDADTGVDESKPESVVNLTGNRFLVGSAAVAFFALGTGLLWALISQTGDMRPAALLAFSMACGYVYQGPPFRFSYKGLGEPLCFLAFGPSATPAFYLAMLPPAAAVTAATAATAAGWFAGIPAWLWSCAVAIGLSTSTILLTSHFHQIEGDKRAGKMSPLVRMGLENGLAAVHAMVAGTYAALIVAAGAGALPSVALLTVAVVSLPSAKDLLTYARDHYKDPPKIAILKRFACFWHIALGVSMAGGLALSRYSPI